MFFRKRKKEEEDDSGEEIRTKRFSRSSDDNSENKNKDPLGRSSRNVKRRKDWEISVWTKKERMIVLFMFLFTVLTSAVLGLNARAWKLPNMPRLTLPKILSEEVIIIENSKLEDAKYETVKRINELIEPLSGVYGIFVLYTSDGSSYGVNERETFEAASLNKLPVMLAMYRQAEIGNINLSSVYVLKEEDKVGGSGSLASREVGEKITYEELVELMGKESDNTAFKISRSILGDDRILATMKDFRLPESLLLENEISPYDMGYFYKRLLDPKKVSRKTRQAILGFLTDTIYESLIPRDLPVSVAHKYGSLPHVRNDAGIVFANDPYILVIMSKGVVELEADEIIPEISSYIYSVENK